jgi:hypothetical protein
MRKLLILLRYVGGHLILIELAFYDRAGRHARLTTFPVKAAEGSVGGR